MSRPGGKYFDEVVQKIQAFKKQEKIVVDREFKTRLRGDLLRKIQTMAPIEREKFDFGTFFSRWRYYFAAIPTLFILVVTVYGFGHLPLSFEKKSIEDSSPVVQLKPDIPPVDLQDNERKNIPESPPVENAPGPASTKTQTKPNSKPKSPLPPPSQSSSKISVPSESEVVQPVESAIPVVPQDIPDNFKSISIPISTPSPVAVPVSISTPTSSPISIQTPSPAPVAIPILDSPAPAPAPAPILNSDSTSSSSPVQPVSSGISVIPPPISPLTFTYSVYFNGTFTSAQKTFFKTTAIPSLAQGKLLSYATVTLRDVSTVGVLLSFADTTSKNYIYKLDVLSGRWQLQ